MIVVREKSADCFKHRNTCDTMDKEEYLSIVIRCRFLIHIIINFYAVRDTLRETTIFV